MLNGRFIGVPVFLIKEFAKLVSQLCCCNVASNSVS